jgi:hypothetical protein
LQTLTHRYYGTLQFQPICFLSFGDTRLPPDFAMIRDRAKNLSKENIFIIKFWLVYRAKDWQRFEEVSLA